MQEKITIARPYAQAAYDYARETGALAQWSALLELLGQIVADTAIRPLLNNPRVSDQQLQELIFELCGERIFTEGGNFIRLLISAGRLQYAPQLNELFTAMRAEAEGIIHVDVVSAYPLEAAQEEAISGFMAKRRNRKVVISSAVDQGLIGGVIIRAGDSVIDASIRGRLNELRNELI